MGFFTPQTRIIRLNENQERAINAIMFGENYMLIAEEQDGRAFIDMNVSNELLAMGLKSACENNPQFLDFLTNLVIDLHTEKK